MKHGVPWDKAFDLSETDAVGMVVSLGEMEGATFAWDRMAWEKK